MKIADNPRYGRDPNESIDRDRNVSRVRKKPNGRNYERCLRRFNPARAISPPPISTILTGSGELASPLNE